MYRTLCTNNEQIMQTANRFVNRILCSLGTRFFVVQWTLVEDNDESIVKIFFPENFDIALKRSIRDVTRKEFHKDYIGKDMPHQRRIVGGEAAGFGVS